MSALNNPGTQQYGCVVPGENGTCCYGDIDDTLGRSGGSAFIYTGHNIQSLSTLLGAPACLHIYAVIKLASVNVHIQPQNVGKF